MERHKRGDRTMSEKIYDDEEDKANAELANIEAQPYPEEEGPQDEES